MIGERLTEYRLRSGFTPLTLAAILRLPRATAEEIINGETKKVPEETAMIIQMLFGVSDDWLHTTR